MHKIYIETTMPEKGKQTNEFGFFSYLFKAILKIDVEIVAIGGKTKLKDFDNQFKDATRSGFRNLVIVDADSTANVESWSFETEKQKIEKLKKELNVEFDLFLLPNNQSEGDFESLLEAIINPQHQRIIDCHQEFENCIEKHKNYVTPNRKARIYSYITSFKRSKKQEEVFKNKGDWFFDNPEYWNFQAEALNPLKNFIRQCLS